MTDRREMRLGRLILEQIEGDAHFEERMSLARHGSRRYRPGKACNRPSIDEKPMSAGKHDRAARQLILDLRCGPHTERSFSLGQEAAHKTEAARASSSGTIRPKAAITASTRRQP